jgi:hypothetical protein
MRQDTESRKVRLATLFVLAILTLGATAASAQEANEEPEHYHQAAIDHEAIILIEDMIEWAETDIQEGVIKPTQGRILIDNLNELLYKLED